MLFTFESVLSWILLYCYYCYCMFEFITLSFQGISLLIWRNSGCNRLI
ncbi:hypothetical protein Goshw_017586 [Gossypium schwendimanii]|uniref:Uncharacterized protein n=1 Tax=Gossypium schwendimanii TaxID=34291 RepID=A0A7J9KT36_GOSSC|nr:hypothetical protein [Gossypium schwendimanii]